MKIVKYSLVIFLVLLLTNHYLFPALLTPAKAAESAPAGQSPLAEIKVTIEDIIKIVEKLPGKENTTERRKALRELINPRFDFKDMSQRCLGPSWLERTDQEKEEFVSVFSSLLANTYLAKIETIKPGMVTFNSETIDRAKALVRTSVKSNGDTFPIDYKLNNESGKWRVYDVIIENIGLVSNYRNEFAGIIRKEKFEGLMVKLREKASKSGGA